VDVIVTGAFAREAMADALRAFSGADVAVGA
jgi:hypothetical protein